MNIETLVAHTKKVPALLNGAAVRFKGKLGAAIAVITSLIVGFLTIPNNILYFIDSKHGTRAMGCPAADSNSAQAKPEYEYAYIHAGIALITLGCLAMVASIVLSYFAAESKLKMDDVPDPYRGAGSKSTRTVITCLIMMNSELFMAVIAGCMELLYQPLISNAQRLHNMECAIAVFNIVIYAMYVVTMVMTSTVLKERRDTVQFDGQRAIPNTAASVQDHRSYYEPYNSMSSFI